MATQLQQTEEATRVLTGLIQESHATRENLRAEIRTVAEHFEARLRDGSDVILAKDVELRNEVKLLASDLGRIEANLSSVGPELQARVSALECTVSQTDNTVQNLCQAVDAWSNELEARIDGRLAHAERHSGAQEVHTQMLGLANRAAERLTALENHVGHLGTARSKEPATASDPAMAFALQSLQEEVTALTAEGTRVASVADECLGEALRHGREAMQVLPTLQDIPRQLTYIKEQIDSAWREIPALAQKVLSLEAAGARKRTPSDPARGASAIPVKPPIMPPSSAPPNAGGASLFRDLDSPTE